jgi:hypothetical protein
MPSWRKGSTNARLDTGVRAIKDDTADGLRHNGFDTLAGGFADDRLDLPPTDVMSLTSLDAMPLP